MCTKIRRSTRGRRNIKPRTMSELKNKRHLAFADEYLVNGHNATQAYLSVYKSVKKKTTAEVNGSKLLSKIEIKEYIQSEVDNVSDNIKRLREELETKKLQLEIKKVDSEMLTIDIKKKLLLKLDGEMDNETKELIIKLKKMLCDDLYFIIADDLGLIKIGRSNNPSKRLRTISNELDTKVEMIKILTGKGDMENLLHKRFKHLNKRFKTNDKINTEWFEITDELTEYINKVK
jgi:phage terminase small subunit